jgi:hypothetical protein
MTISDIKAANKAAGQHWFSRDTMRFFGTRIESKVYKGGVFITSEQPPHGPRMYSVRRACADGTIDTVGKFCGYQRLKDARIVARLESKPSRYKVAQPGGRWKRGFATLEDANLYASQVYQDTGVIAAVEVDA